MVEKKPLVIEKKPLVLETAERRPLPSETEGNVDSYDYDNYAFRY